MDVVIVGCMVGKLIFNRNFFVIIGWFIVLVWDEEGILGFEVIICEYEFLERRYIWCYFSVVWNDNFDVVLSVLVMESVLCVFLDCCGSKLFW